MNAPKIVNVQEQDGSQVVVLPDGVRLPEGPVEVTQSGDTVTLRAVQKPKTAEELRAMWAEIDRLAQGRFMEKGRQQPALPPDDDLEPLS
jgi:virulence-associated protein VagC